MSGQQLVAYNNLGGEQKQLPTIVENAGFEAQVLDYLAGKTGMQRGRLFCVDEEPSSCNEDLEARESPTGGRELPAIHAADIYNSSSAQQTAEMISDPPTMKIEIYQPTDDAVEVQQRPLVGERPENYVHAIDGQKNMIDGQQQQQNLQVADFIYHESDAESGKFQSVNEQILPVASNASGQFQQLIANDEPQQQQAAGQQQIVVEASHVPTVSSDAHLICEEQFAPISAGQATFQQEQQKMEVSYDSEKDEDGRILMSKVNGGAEANQRDDDDDGDSLGGHDEDDCDDEQYRDINNLADLEGRATNHVHAIDGHSKSMLNDIHQQRTIVDYYDDEYANGGNHFDSTIETTTPDLRHDDDDYARDEKVAGDGGEYPAKFSSPPTTTMNLRDDVDARARLDDDSNYQADSNVAGDLAPEIADVCEGGSAAATEEQQDYTTRAADDEGELPRARMRWIHAVNKIVNRSGEVSSGISNSFFSLFVCSSWRFLFIFVYFYPRSVSTDLNCKSVLVWALCT